MKEGKFIRQTSRRNFGKSLDTMWQENPALIRQFLEQRPDCEQICAEVVYILKKRLKEIDVEISNISSRAKTLDSFLEKIQRKGYSNPFEQNTDFSAIRIVHLYAKDAKCIGDVIRKEFIVLNDLDKSEEMDPHHFGYLATHFIAKLNPEVSGVRYEDLKHLVFEIQVRTVLQDAWAIVDHHLAYKRESDVPKHLLRKLMRVAAMFEMIDDSFDDIQQAVNQYIADLNESSQNDERQFLNNHLDLDSFTAYLKWKFKNLPVEGPMDDVSIVFDRINKENYRILEDLDNIIHFSESDIKELGNAYNTSGDNSEIGSEEDYTDFFPDNVLTSAFLVYVALLIWDNNFRQENYIHPKISDFILNRLDSSK